MNVTLSERAMKGEVQQHLDHKCTRDQMVNVELLMQQRPNLGELIMQLVRMVEDLEAAMMCKENGGASKEDPSVREKEP